MHEVGGATTEAKDPASLQVAAFDFDGTLTRRDTLLPYLWRSLGWPRFLLAILRSAPWLAAYACRIISNHKAKARLLQASLGGANSMELERWTADFVETYLPRQWDTAMLARLRWHQERGHCCLIISASPGIYLHRTGEVLHMDGVLCTELEFDGTVLTGRMQTRNCHGEEKVRRLKAWLADRHTAANPVILHAYGDSRGDVPLLNLADYAHYQGQPWVRKTSRM
jgi:phosphatidylglycerophosphatase C